MAFGSRRLLGANGLCKQQRQYQNYYELFSRGVLQPDYNSRGGKRPE